MELSNTICWPLLYRLRDLFTSSLNIIRLLITYLMDLHKNFFIEKNREFIKTAPGVFIVVATYFK